MPRKIRPWMGYRRYQYSSPGSPLGSKKAVWISRQPRPTGSTWYWSQAGPGSRISARTQSVRTSGSMMVYVQLFGGPHNPDRWWYGQKVTAYGHNAANSAGTKFTPGDTGAEGTGVSLGTTTANHGCLVLGVQGHPDDVAWAGRTYHFDVGLDSTATQWLLADYWIAGSTSTELLGCDGLWLPLFWPVLSGSVLMVRGECSGTADALSAAIYGVS